MPRRKPHYRLHVAQSLPHNGQPPFMWQVALHVTRHNPIACWHSKWHRRAESALRAAGHAWRYNMQGHHFVDTVGM